MRWFVFRRASVAAGLALAGGLMVSASPQGDAGLIGPGGVNVDQSTIPQLQQAMDKGRLTSVGLTKFYIQRIHTVDGTMVHSVLRVTSDAVAQAAASDKRRASHKLRGPMDGIPILLKDNVGDGQTTAGSLALAGATPPDAFIVTKLKAGGAVILGKTNLSEWANFRSTQSTSGWSGVGGQTNNPYVLDRNPCGSSSGSGAAVAADLATVAIGTETDGSIVCPSGVNGLAGLKPSIGRVSRTGIVPISHEQDTSGPMARNVTDDAVLLGVIAGADPADPPTVGAPPVPDYTKFLKADALKGARIGVWREGNVGQNIETDRIFDNAVAQLRRLGATVVDPVTPPGLNQIGGPEGTALNCEFKHDINAYLAADPGPHPRTLADLIAFNRAHAAREMPFFQQETFEQAQATSGDLNDPACSGPRKTATTTAQQAIDQTLAANHLNAIVAPTVSPSWPTDLINGDHVLIGSSSPAAVAGYPNINVPAGSTFGLPVGISFMASRFAEPELLALAFSFEQGTHARKPPRFLRSAPSTDGIRPWPPGAPDSGAVMPAAPVAPGSVPGTRPSGRLFGARW